MSTPYVYALQAWKDWKTNKLQNSRDGELQKHIKMICEVRAGIKEWLAWHMQECDIYRRHVKRKDEENLRRLSGRKYLALKVAFKLRTSESQPLSMLSISLERAFLTYATMST